MPYDEKITDTIQTYDTVKKQTTIIKHSNHLETDGFLLQIFQYTAFLSSLTLHLPSSFLDILSLHIVLEYRAFYDHFLSYKSNSYKK